MPDTNINPSRVANIGQSNDPPPPPPPLAATLLLEELELEELDELELLDDAVTVSVAALLFTALTVFVATARNWSPDSPVVVATLNVGVVLPPYVASSLKSTHELLPFAIRCHL